MAVSRDHMWLQCSRLRRHHHIATVKRDDISFLDVTHCLRIWVDMKRDVDAVLATSTASVVFRHARKNRQLLRALKGSTLVHLPLATGWDHPFGRVQNFLFVDRLLTDEEISELSSAPNPEPVGAKMNLTGWLGTEIFEARRGNGERIGLSREMLIKRVANMLGASHPMGSEDASENRFDAIVEELHALRLTDVAATFYQIMEIASDLLEALDCLFPIMSQESTRQGE